MRNRFILAALMCTPLSAFADVVEDAAKLTVALEEAGCVFTAENGAAIATAAGLTEETLLQAVNELFTKSLVSVTADGSMKLETEACK